MTPWAYICIWQRPEAIMHIEAGHVDSNWPEFTFVFTYISCLNRLALSAISLKTNSLSYLILFIISLVSIYKREKALNQLLTYKLIETCKDNLAFKYLMLISLFHQVLSSFSEVAIEGLFVSS